MHTCACLSWYSVSIGNPSMFMWIKFGLIPLTASKFPINVEVPLPCGNGYFYSGAEIQGWLETFNSSLQIWVPMYNPTGIV